MAARGCLGSTERDYIYVTTATLNRAQLAQLSEELGRDRTLLICCGAFRAKAGEFPNLTVKKIPNAVLHRCEWGRDDYSLRVAALPAPEPEQPAPEPPEPAAAVRKRDAEPSLFGEKPK